MPGSKQRSPDNHICSENQGRYRRPEIDQKIGIAHKIFQQPGAQYPAESENNPCRLKENIVIIELTRPMTVNHITRFEESLRFV